MSYTLYWVPHRRPGEPPTFFPATEFVQSGRVSQAGAERHALILRNSGQVVLKLIPLAHLYNAYIALNLLEHGKHFELCLAYSEC